jgi:flavin-binding protein dodecin
MSVAKVTEISASSNTSFEDAVRRGIARAAKTIHNMQASVEEPGLIAKILGHVQAYEAAGVTDARAPPGNLQEALRLL